jgi:hypothetical protein
MRGEGLRVHAQVTAGSLRGTVREEPRSEKDENEKCPEKDRDAGKRELCVADRPTRRILCCLRDEEVDRGAGEEEQRTGVGGERERDEQL